VQVFGRLAEGVTVDAAQAELTTIGRRLANDAPETKAVLQSQVVPYSDLFFDPRSFGVGLALANVFLIMLAVTAFANVSLLVFAPAASRESEIGVRNALGASRGRIVVQLFVEAMALSALSVVAGLVAARYALGSLWDVVEADSGRTLPFWINDSLTPSTIA
jgi:putative ABC transport system permease protein